MKKDLKQCKYCQKYYPELDFGVAKTTTKKIYRRRKCRYCYRKTKNDLKQKRRRWLDTYKSERGCCKCGTNDFRVLEFHHKNPKEKEFTIADYYYHQFSFANLQKELAKCIVICANCHRILHYNKRSK